MIVARPGRYFLPDQPLHVIQRGNNRQPVFFESADFVRYRNWLLDAAHTNGCAVHAYVLMSNHVHLLLSPLTEASLPATMQSLGRRYVRYINAIRGRTGTLWEGRYRAAPIDTEAHFLACSRYIELNPVRAGMVEHPGDYPWSSYAAHARCADDPLLTDHSLYLGLGVTVAERTRSYRALFRDALGDAFLSELRGATNGGWAFGDDAFKRRIARALGRPVAPRPRGRPPRPRCGTVADDRL